MLKDDNAGRKKGMWKKVMLYRVTVFYREDEELPPYEDYLYETYAEAVAAKHTLEKDDSVDEVIVEDEPEEVEIWF